MIVEVPVANRLAMSLSISSLAKEACVTCINPQEGVKPVDVILRRLSLVAVSVQPMGGNNAGNTQSELLTV